MKTYMLIVAAISGACLTALCAPRSFVKPAFGGIKALTRGNVLLSNLGNGQMSAFGDIGTVRSSADSVQNLWCYLEADAAGPTITVECQATDLNGNTLNCESTSPVLVQALSAINSDSELLFVANVSDGGSNTCTKIQVKTGSYINTKQQ